MIKTILSLNQLLFIVRYLAYRNISDMTIFVTFLCMCINRGFYDIPSDTQVNHFRSKKYPKLAHKKPHVIF